MLGMKQSKLYCTDIKSISELKKKRANMSTIDITESTAKRINRVLTQTPKLSKLLN